MKKVHVRVRKSTGEERTRACTHRTDNAHTRIGEGVERELRVVWLTRVDACSHTTGTHPAHAKSRLLSERKQGGKRR